MKGGAPKVLKALEAHKLSHTGMDKTARRIQAEWLLPGMTADSKRLVSAYQAVSRWSAIRCPTRTDNK